MSKRDIIHINDLFFTVQGEGFHAGRRALFVRMPFCDLACDFCDTEFNSFERYTIDAFNAFMDKEPTCSFAVITGGEPMMHKHTPKVIELLKARGYEIACESNGRWPILKGIDFATVSPKGQAKEPFYIHPDAMQKASEFKYVVDHAFDWNMLDRHDVTDGRRYSLSPEFTDFQGNVAMILQFMETHPGWRLSLQTHKWIGIA